MAVMPIDNRFTRGDVDALFGVVVWTANHHAATGPDGVFADAEGIVTTLQHIRQTAMPAGAWRPHNPGSA